MLSVEDCAAIMVGSEAGVSQVRIARSMGRSPLVVSRAIARHRGPGGVYKAQDAGRAAQVARRRPKKRLLDRDEVVRCRVIADLSQGRTPRQISAPSEHGGMRHSGSYGQFSPRPRPHASWPSPTRSPPAILPTPTGRDLSHEAIDTCTYAHPNKTLIEHGMCLPSRRWMRKKPPTGGRTPPIVGMR